MIHRVLLSKRAAKDLEHDEALKGNRKGQRSIRLSKAYRAIYRIVKEEVVFILVEEVNKHAY